MKILMTYFLGCCAGLHLFGQAIQHPDRIQGRVLDSVSRAPLTGALLSLSDSSTGKVVRVVVADDNGLFSVSGLTPGGYIIEASMTGYEKKWQEVPGPGDQSVITILLSPLAIQLGGVTVTATRPVIRREADRIIYDVQADTDSKTQNLLDLFRKVPLISVDGEDNIKLKGDDNFRILINGRPSSLVARNPKEAFQAMPAGTVLRIEVITTPPAKYDAEGITGIINIVTTSRKSEEGYSGSIGGRYHSVNGVSENVSITARNGRLGITAARNLYQNFRRRTELAYYRYSNIDLSWLDQTGNNHFKGGQYRNARLELTYAPDSISMITLTLGVYGSSYKQDIRQQSGRYAGGVLAEQYALLNESSHQESGFDIDFNYQVGFTRHKGQFLTLSYNQVYFPNEDRNRIRFSDRLHYAQPDFNQFNDNGTKEKTLQADFTRPLANAGFDLGAKAILRNSYSNFTGEIYDDTQQVYLEDPNQSDEFRYSQHVLSLYHSWYWQIRSAEIRAGIRLEHTRVDANFKMTPVPVRQSYTHPVPSLSIRQKLTDRGNISFGFTQRIYRPGIWRLNPYVDRVNPQMLSSGNPELRAVLNNNFELNYSRTGKISFNTGISYLFANHTIESVTTLQDSVSYAVYQNTGKYRNLQLNLSSHYPVNPKLTVTFNGFVSYIARKGTYAGKPVKNQGAEASVTATLSYKVNDSWTFSFNNNFLAPYVLLQGSTNSIYTSSFHFSKFLFNKKLVVALSLNNPYQEFWYARTLIEMLDFVQGKHLQRNYRSIVVSATWNTGNLQASLKKTKRRIINDDTRP